MRKNNENMQKYRIKIVTKNAIMRKEELDIRQAFGSLQFKEQQDFLAYCQDYLDKKQSRYVKTYSLEDWLDDNTGVAGIGAKDANGVEIHEGDVLYECSTGTILTVIWNKDTCAFALREAGWLNRSNWHLLCRDSKAAAAAKGNHVGRNHETGRKIAEMCEHWQIPFSLVRPLPLTARGGIKQWRGKGGKITQEEIVRILLLINRRFVVFLKKYCINIAYNK